MICVPPKRPRRAALGVSLAALAALSPVAALADDAADTTDPVVKAYTLQKDRAVAKKAALDAEADLALATSAKVPKGPYTGAVTVGEKAGEAEANMIAARAVTDAAELIAKSAPDSCSKVVVVAGNESLTMGHWRVYETRRQMIDTALGDATAVFNQAVGVRDVTERPAAAKPTKVAPGFSVGMAAVSIGAALDTITKLGSFFQTDYEVKGVAITADDMLFREAMSGALLAKRKAVAQPLRLASATSQDRITTDLIALHRKAVAAAGDHDAAVSEANRLHAQAEAAAKKDPAYAKALNAAAARFDAAAGVAKAALDDYAAFLTYLSGADSAGVPNLQPILVEESLETWLFGPAGARATQAGVCALALKVNNMGGGIYTKKNLWTFLGTMPFYVGGVATVTYTYIDPASGQVLAAGSVERHGGYGKLHEIVKTYSAPDS